MIAEGLAPYDHLWPTGVLISANFPVTQGMDGLVIHESASLQKLQGKESLSTKSGISTTLRKKVHRATMGG